MKFRFSSEETDQFLLLKHFVKPTRPIAKITFIYRVINVLKYIIW